MGCCNSTPQCLEPERRRMSMEPLIEKRLKSMSSGGIWEERDKYRSSGRVLSTKEDHSTIAWVGKQYKSSSLVQRRRDVCSIFAEHGMMVENSIDSSCLIATPTSTCSSLTSLRGVSAPLSPTLEGNRCNSDASVALNLCYGSYTTAGQRDLNEDRLVCTTDIVNQNAVGYFGIYDGHGGAFVSEYLASTLHANIFSALEESNDMAHSMKQGMEVTDTNIYNENIHSGSTAICMMIQNNELVIASLGDSQAILCSKDGKAIDICTAHRPSLNSEMERIINAKGTIVSGRIFGVLAVSRAFGDNEFKTSKGEFKDKFNGDLVSSTPDITTRLLQDDDEFIVLGCDGILDVMTPQEMITFVRNRLRATNDVHQTSEDLAAHALRLGSTDNLSVIIVCFHQHATSVTY